RAARARAPLQAAGARGRDGFCRREGPQPPGHPGAPACRRADPGGGMSLPARPLGWAPHPAAAPASDPQRTLRALEQPQPGRRPRLLYGIIAVGGALAIAAAQMGLSILTTQGSYEVAALTTQQRQLDWDRQMLADQVAGLSS